jgi:hypothetical protein
MPLLWISAREYHLDPDCVLPSCWSGTVALALSVAVMAIAAVVTDRLCSKLCHSEHPTPAIVVIPIHSPLHDVSQSSVPM